MTDGSIEAALLAGITSVQQQLGGVERSLGEMGQSLRGLTRDAGDDRKRVEKLELQVAYLMNLQNTNAAIRKRDKGLVAAAAAALTVLAAMSRDILAMVRSSL